MNSLDIFLILLEITLLVPLFSILFNNVGHYIFIPWRKPDFKHRHWEYWFESDMVAYSRLARERFKFELHRPDQLTGQLYSLRRVKNNTSFDPGFLEYEVCIAYKQHIESKFEEIVLDVKS